MGSRAGPITGSAEDGAPAESADENVPIADSGLTVERGVEGGPVCEPAIGTFSSELPPSLMPLPVCA